MNDRTCAVDGCESPQAHLRMCTKHYTRFARNGDPLLRSKPKACVVCGAEFVGYGRQVCCSLDCRRAKLLAYGRDYQTAKRAVSPAPRVPRVPTPCEYCGTVFGATKRRSRYCSDECRAIDRHRANWKHLNARRARLRDAFVEAFDRREIFERDGWVCQICLDPIDPSITWPHPMSASLDHIEPVSRGGEHSRANAQASHLTCNVRKGDRVS